MEKKFIYEGIKKDQRHKFKPEFVKKYDEWIANANKTGYVDDIKKHESFILPKLTDEEIETTPLKLVEPGTIVVSDLDFNNLDCPSICKILHMEGVIPATQFEKKRSLSDIINEDSSSSSSNGDPNDYLEEKADPPSENESDNSLGYEVNPYLEEKPDPPMSINIINQDFTPYGFPDLSFNNFNFNIFDFKKVDFITDYGFPDLGFNNYNDDFVSYYYDNYISLDMGNNPDNIPNNIIEEFDIEDILNVVDDMMKGLSIEDINAIIEMLNISI